MKPTRTRECTRTIVDAFHSAVVLGDPDRLALSIAMIMQAGGEAKSADYIKVMVSTISGEDIGLLTLPSFQQDWVLSNFSALAELVARILQKVGDKRSIEELKPIAETGFNRTRLIPESDLIGIAN